MVKKCIFLITSIICVFVSTFALCYAWFGTGNNSVTGTAGEFVSTTPGDIQIDIDRPDKSSVNFPVIGEDGLIPCAPIGSGIDAIDSDEWFIPSFLPSERGDRCCYWFDVSVFSSAGFTGIKRVAITMTPHGVDVRDTDEDGVLSEAEKAATLTDAQNAQQERNNQLRDYIECAAIVLKGNEIGVDQLVAHTNYSVYDQVADDYVEAGALTDDFYYEFKPNNDGHRTNNNQKIRILVWIDGFVPTYSQLAGGEITMEVSFLDKTPGGGGIFTNNQEVADSFVAMYQEAKALVEAQQGKINKNNVNAVHEVVSLYDSLTTEQKGLINAEVKEEVTANLDGENANWRRALNSYEEIQAYLAQYERYKDQPTVTTLNDQNIRTVVNYYRVLEDAQLTLLRDSTEFENGPAADAQAQEWIKQLEVFDRNKTAAEAFLNTYYYVKYNNTETEVSELEVTPGNTDEQKAINAAIQNVLDKYGALEDLQKTYISATHVDAYNQIEAWQNAFDDLEANKTVINGFMEEYNALIDKHKDKIVTSGNKADFLPVVTKFNGLSGAQKDLIRYSYPPATGELSVADQIAAWEATIGHINAVDAFVAEYNRVTVNGTKVDITELTRATVEELLLKYDIEIAPHQVRVDNIPENIQTQIEAWKNALKNEKLEVRWDYLDDNLDGVADKDVNAIDGKTWIEGKTVSPKENAATVTNDIKDQVLKNESGVTITAIANKTSAEYKATYDKDGKAEGDSNLRAKELGINYMVKGGAYYSKYESATSKTENPNAIDFMTIELPQGFSGKVTVVASPFLSAVDKNTQKNPKRFITLRLSNKANDDSLTAVEGQSVIVSAPKNDANPQGYYIALDRNSELHQYAYEFTVKTGGKYYLSNLPNSDTATNQKASGTVFISSISVVSATDNVDEFRRAVTLIDSTTGSPENTQAAITRADELYEKILPANRPQVEQSLAKLNSWKRANVAIQAIAQIGEINANNFRDKKPLYETAQAEFDKLTAQEDIDKVYNASELTTAKTAIEGFETQAGESLAALIAKYEAAINAIDSSGPITEDNYTAKDANEKTVFDRIDAARAIYENEIPAEYYTDKDVASLSTTLAVKRARAVNIRDLKEKVDALAAEVTNGTPITSENAGDKITAGNFNNYLGKLEEAERIYLYFTQTKQENAVAKTHAILAAIRTKIDDVIGQAFTTKVRDLATAFSAANESGDRTALNEAINGCYTEYADIASKSADVETAKATLDNYNRIEEFLTLYNKAAETGAQADKNKAVLAYDAYGFAAAAEGATPTEAQQLFGSLTNASTIRTNINSWRTPAVATDAIKVEWLADKNANDETGITWFGVEKLLANNTTAQIAEDYTLKESDDGAVRIIAIAGKAYSDLSKEHKQLVGYVKADHQKDGEVQFLKVVVPTGFKGTLTVKASPFDSPTEAEHKRTIDLSLSDGTTETVVQGQTQSNVSNPESYVFNIDTTGKTGYTTYYLSNKWHNGNGTNANPTVFVQAITLLSEGCTPPTEKHAVTFDSNGGSAVPAQRVENNGTATAPTAPTRGGYTFVGWFTDEGLTNAFSFGENGTKVTADITLYAKWNQDASPVYTITFNWKGHTDSSFPASQQTVAASLTSLPAPVITDSNGIKYTVAGWYLNENLSGTAVNLTTKFSDSTTIYADWVRLYTVTFKDGDTILSTEEVKDGHTATRPTAPTKPGFVFDKWLKDGAEYNFSTTVTGDITLTASWTEKSFTVTFNPKGGEMANGDSKTKTVGYGAKIEKPTDPTREGYIFVCWRTSDQYNKGVEVDFDNVILTDENAATYAKVYAIWKVKVTFNLNGATATAPAEQEVFEHGTATRPADPTWDGHTFGGWFTDAECTTAFNFDTDIDADITLYAKWTETPTEYTVTFNYNDGATQNTSATVAAGGKVAEPTAPTRANYMFNGWFLGDATEAFNFDTAIDADTTLTAHWVLTNFVVGDNSEVTGLTLGTGNRTALETAITSDIWSIPVGTDIRKNGTEYSIRLMEANDKLVVNVPKAGYLVLNVKNGSGSYSGTAKQAIKVNNTVYGFASAGTQTIWIPVQAGEYTITSATGGTVDLYWARFETDIPADTTTATVGHIVTFDANGGSKVNKQFVENNGKATKPTDPTKADYTFGGWFLGSATEAFNFNTAITSDITLTAKWNEVATEYTVTFNLNGATGTAPESLTTVGGKLANLPADPTWGDYTFGGWFTDAGCTGTRVTTETSYTSATTLYAKWLVTVTFVHNNGSNNTQETVTAGSAVTLPTPSRDNVTFKGWCLNSNLSDSSPITATTYTPSSGSITLYAKWVATVTFDSMGGTAVSQREIIADTAYGTLPTTTKEGYTFLGWFTDRSDGQGTELEATTVITANTAYFAHWQQNTTTDPAQGVLWDSKTVSTTDWQGTGKIADANIKLTPDGGTQGFEVTVIKGKATVDTSLVNNTTTVQYDNIPLARMIKVNKGTEGFIKISVPAGFDGKIIVYAGPYSAKKGEVTLKLLDSANEAISEHTEGDAKNTVEGFGVTSSGCEPRAFELAVTNNKTSAADYTLTDASDNNIFITKIEYKRTSSGGGTTDPTPTTPTTTTEIRFNNVQTGKFTTEIDFGNGVKVVTGGDEMEIEAASPEKFSESVSFTKMLKTGGTIKSAGRFIQVTVDGACTIKIYAMSGSSSKTRKIVCDTTPNKDSENNVSLSGDKIYVAEFSVAAGTYYIGSQDSGINIYGIDITPTPAA